MRGTAAERQALGNALREPFLLKPAAKDYLWGGNRLNDDFGKGIDLSPLAETWECSTHPDGPSTIASGKFAGKLLPDFIEKHPEVLGTHPRKLVSEGLPVLIKFIDAKKDLSVQVHPDDEYARTHEGGQLGKTEMWYVCILRPLPDTGAFGNGQPATATDTLNPSQNFIKTSIKTGIFLAHSLSLVVD